MTTWFIFRYVFQVNENVNDATVYMCANVCARIRIKLLSFKSEVGLFARCCVRNWCFFFNFIAMISCLNPVFRCTHVYTLPNTGQRNRGRGMLIFFKYNIHSVLDDANWSYAQNALFMSTHELFVWQYFVSTNHVTYTRTDWSGSLTSSQCWTYWSKGANSGSIVWGCCQDAVQFQGQGLTMPSYWLVIDPLMVSVWSV